jgi:DNA polymerase III subunit alpha
MIEQTKRKIDFVHLHNHSDHSVLDGMCRISDLVRRARQLDMPAIISDHGNMSGAVEGYITAKKEGVKPIIGCELYYVSDMKERNDRLKYHLVLLAKDNVGYHNLQFIVSEGYSQGLYYVPRVDLEIIRKHSQGLIAMTACIAGYVPSMILQGNMNEAKAELGRLKEIFEDDLYIEVMDHGIEEQKIANPELIRLGKAFDIPIVATNDCHYINSDDYLAHDVLLCIQTGKTLSDPDRFRFRSDQFYFKSAEEMLLLFPETYLTKTLEVAEKCNLDLDLYTTHLPKFTTPDGSVPDVYLRRRLHEGIQQRFGGNISQAYMDRLAREYNVIKKTGFSSYFLIVDDMVQYAKKQGIRVGPRGSVIGCLVSYLLDITDIDPMPYDLLFERFLTEARKSPPDIDLDFSSNRREEVINYLQGKYGFVSQITTFNRLSPRSLVRDIGRVLGLSKEKIDATAKSIHQNIEPDVTLSELQSQIPELNSIDPRVIEIGTKLHGVIRHHGKHPGGIVISDRPITDIIPLCVSKGVTLTQFDKDGVEATGMLKMDILGSKYLSVVDKTLELIWQRHRIQLRDTDMDDKETYDLICSGAVLGIFQLGQACAKEIVERMLPRSFNDLVQLIAIGRPGVISSGLVDKYFEAKSSGRTLYLHLDFEPILNETLGVIIYQEQIMRIAVDIAGFDWSDADELRKAVAKQKVGLMEPFKDKFIAGLMTKGIQQQIAEELWSNQILIFGKYCFAKSHSVGYAQLTYLTAYLKTHYPLEYLASLISVKDDVKDERKQYISEAKGKGINVLTPDINLSTNACVIADDAIYLPLTMIKNVGASAYNAIAEERANGEFKSVEDFCERIDGRRVNKNVKRNLAKAGAFDSLYDRSSLLKRIFDADDTELIMMEREVLGLYISGNIINESFYSDGTIHISEISDLALEDEFMTLGIVENVYEHVDRNGNTMAFITLVDNTAQLDVVIFSDAYECAIGKGDLILLEGKLDEYNPLKAIATSFDLLSGVTS